MASFSHFTIINLDNVYTAKLLFPGSANVKLENFGYIRSKAREELAFGSSEISGKHDIPFRSYDSKILTNADSLLRAQDKDHILLISARNVFNEYGYHARIDDCWYRCTGEESLNPDWPVALFSKQKITMLPYKSIPSNGDVLTGLPLVIDGQPVSRTLIVSNCSDQSHAYNVHPKGLIGPSSEAWHELSEAWELGKQDGLSDEALFRRLQGIATAHKAVPSQNLLHSLMAQTQDKQIFFMTATGALTDIARQLVLLNAKNAILLDNGGSIGWRYLRKKGGEPLMLVAGPNHRPNGTVFISIDLTKFLQPASHFEFGCSHA